MLKNDFVSTGNPIVDCSILMDSSRTMALLKVSDRELSIKMFNMETFKLDFEEKITGRYLKCSGV